ncbi:MAG TPA: VWA domain-containing protein [Anaerolineae bacterium]|nr:VWA domain-containing protein [Anaerolineae bacterium]HOQ97655.1 VWA domain-containing protein [Anaerolineae bacterium]HPL27699.1 VWA domain-containing protein [Anaerolineae bacterium]
MAGLGRFLASCRLAAPERLIVGAALTLLIIFVPVLFRKRGLAFDWAFWRGRVALAGPGVWALRALVAVASLLLAAFLAQPEVETREHIPISGKPVMVVVDVSGSMGYAKGAGETVSGFERARQVAFSLFDRDLDADLGLLLYSSENYIARYFASRKELLRDTLENTAEIRDISYGTRTGAALAEARRFFADQVGLQDRAILLISDLEEGPGGTAQIASEIDAIVKAGTKLYIIVMGDGTPLEVEEDARLAALRRPEITMVSMNDDYGIDQICREIVSMASSPIRERDVIRRKSLVPSLLPPALAALALALVLSETCLRKIP